MPLAPYIYSLHRSVYRSVYLALHRPLQRLRARRPVRVLLWLVGLYVALRVVLWFVPRPPLLRDTASSVAVYDAHRHLLRLTLAADQRYRLFTPLPRISPVFVEATLLYEDRHFYHHFAVNPVALLRAAWSTYGGGGRRIGGSTLTMQLARRLYGLQSRTPMGKLRQIARAAQLELLYSKDQILEAYLNLVSYGGNIEGIGAASLIYFGKRADQLLLQEALALAVIPQSPARRGGEHAAPQTLLAARAALFQRWVQRHPAARKDEALIGLPLSRLDPTHLPFLAPHFVESVLAARAPAPTRETEIVTSLDLNLQRLLSRHVRGYIDRNRRIGLHNAAALLVDARTMEVRAALGSVDFFDDSIAGQVNGTQAKRSPGSTLKPFIYALGLEQGVIHPLTMLKDTPQTFGAFSPENFDGRFVGPISAREALWRSRNIPALWVAARLLRPSLYDFLKSAGVSRLRSEAHYGLSLVLGGAEVTMEELVTLYGALASGGVLRPLRLQPAPATPGVRVLSEEATYLVLDMLKDNPRPDRMRVDDPGAPVAWKTGTSYGFRDAWSVGLFGPYVLAVWLGNFSGEGNPALVGITAAAPLFFEIVDSVRAHERHLGAARWAGPTAPRTLGRVQVCAVSGQVPGPHCAQKRSTWFIPGRSPIDVCQIHREVRVDDRTGQVACPPYVGPTHAEVFEFWPSDMQRLFQLAGIPRRKPPGAGRGCAVTDAATRGVAPRITSPLPGVTYTLRGGGGPGRPAAEQIAFQAVTDADAREVYWFVNETYVGKARSGSALMWTPTAGVYMVRAVDDQGRADARDLRVELAPRKGGP